MCINFMSMCFIVYFSDDEADKWKVSVANSHCFHLLLDLPAKFTHKVFDIVIHLVSSGNNIKINHSLRGNPSERLYITHCLSFQSL